MKKRPQSSLSSRPLKSAGARNKLRIIGGRWRARQLSFPDQEGLRPTGDRIRETLFNWLAPNLPGAHCLDLFGGSGALSFEAVSRGAASATMIDTSDRACRALLANREALHAEQEITVLNADTLQWLHSATDRRFDIVFVDPPFGSDLLEPALTALAKSMALHPGSLVYVESALDTVYDVPKGWKTLRQKQSGKVSYRLLEIEAPSPASQ